MRRTILVVGFEPFGGEPINPVWKFSDRYLGPQLRRGQNRFQDAPGNREGFV